MKDQNLLNEIRSDKDPCHCMACGKYFKNYTVFSLHALTTWFRILVFEHEPFLAHNIYVRPGSCKNPQNIGLTQTEHGIWK